MLKEASETAKALLEFFRSGWRVVLTIFICSAIWLWLHHRNLVRVPIDLADKADRGAFVALLLSGAYLVLIGLEWLYLRFEKWRRSEEHRLRKGLAQASPLEKLVLEDIIRRSEHYVALDVGSPTAMHLQQLGLIESTGRLRYTTYELAPGLADLCIRKPSLLHTSERQRKAAEVELKQWCDEGLHQGLLNHLREPPGNPWMDL
jgi:hypothetical protein